MCSSRGTTPTNHHVRIGRRTLASRCPGSRHPIPHQSYCHTGRRPKLRGTSDRADVQCGVGRPSLLVLDAGHLGQNLGVGLAGLGIDRSDAASFARFPSLSVYRSYSASFSGLAGLSVYRPYSASFSGLAGLCIDRSYAAALGLGAMIPCRAACIRRCCNGRCRNGRNQ